MSYNYDELTRLLEDCGTMRTEKFQKRLMRILTSSDFKDAIFRPNRSDTTANQKIANIYKAACKSKVVDEIVDAIDEYGYRNLDRTNACFFITLVNLGVDVINQKSTEVADAKEHADISNRKAEEVIRKMEKYQRTLNDLLKFSRKIVKTDAKIIARESGVPKDFCIVAMYSSPDPEYIDRYKVGFYLNTLLSNLYSVVNLGNLDWDFDDIDWRAFFKGVFGKSNLVEVATMILLEGVKRIDKYQNNHEVKECWDSLTTFALSELNKAPETIRDQMIELYLKRLNKMLSNHGIDLRVDLRAIDNFKFENLAKTVDQYKDKINAILDRAKAIMSDKATVTE